MLRKTKKRFSVHKNLNYYVFVTKINKIIAFYEKCVILEPMKGRKVFI